MQSIAQARTLLRRKRGAVSNHTKTVRPTCMWGHPVTTAFRETDVLDAGT